jgi:hypothetical protein
MERIRPSDPSLQPDSAEHTLFDIVAAIDLVATGGAVRVVLASLPGPERVAAEALAHAQAAGVAFRLDRGAGRCPPCVVVGPATGLAIGPGAQ